MKPANLLPADRTNGIALASRRILVPLDLDEASLPVLRYAARLAKAEQGSVCLLHVADFGPFKSDVADSPMFHSTAHIIERAERQMRFWARRELPPELPRRILVTSGKTTREVVKAAANICADLIVLAPPRVGWLSRILMGDPTRWIEVHAPCSVIVLREPHYGPCNCSALFESQPANATAIAA